MQSRILDDTLVILYLSMITPWQAYFGLGNPILDWQPDLGLATQSWTWQPNLGLGNPILD